MLQPPLQRTCVHTSDRFCSTTIQSSVDGKMFIFIIGVRCHQQKFSRMMPRKRKRLTPLNAVQSKPSFSPADTSGSLTVVLDGNSSPVSSKYFSEEKRTSSRLGTDFFNQSCISLAKSFLGQILVHKLPDGRELRGKIVETEAYLGGEDAASHSKGGKQTARNTAMFMKPGTLYVYQIYGIYFCMNVSSQAEAHLEAKQLLRCMTRKTGSRSVENQKKQYRQFFGEGAAVLLRSLEPLQGLDTMRQLRSTQRKGSAKPLKDWQLCNGPSKLCQALAINKSFDQKDLARDTAIWMEPGSEAPGEQAVVTAARIGVSYGGEWAQKPLRFYIRGNKCVSVVDKKVEREQGAAD
ncbi:DNA-3-methyladenine glycosylase isoform X4 [Trachemys scripta elegans]|uniref:DNA-3-methyladenine glycosylase isoform X4 n=1 Tax=Trachemys scripta elegans TaxID=31138 RepID=UPI0015517D96|nr:DNA-3-methyladenine glycosylase isoform X4 [Trachemys scripta elegans]